MKGKKVFGLLLIALLLSIISPHTSNATSPQAMVPFEDVKESDWHYKYVKYVFNNKIMTGKTDKIFAPVENLARAQFAMILYRMNGSPEIGVPSTFPDIVEGEWYTKAVMWASTNGFITGYADTGYFGPSDNMNREQLATVMYRYAMHKGYEISGMGTLEIFPDAGWVNGFSGDPVRWAVGAGIISGDQGRLNPQTPVNRAVCATIIQRFIDRYVDNPIDYTATLEVYKPILEEYQKAVANNYYLGDGSRIPNVNAELFSVGANNSKLSYSLVDLVGDGVPELFIANFANNLYYENGYNIYDIYGYSNGKVKRIFDVYSMGYRNIYTIRTDNSIRVRGSGSAFSYGFQFYRLDGDGVSPSLTRTMEYDGFSGSQYYDQMAGGAKTKITEKRWNEILAQYKEKTDVAWYKL